MQIIRYNLYDLVMKEKESRTTSNITVGWVTAETLPPIKRVPTVYSPTPELEGYAERINRLSPLAGVIPRTDCDFCTKPLPRSGKVSSLRNLTIMFLANNTKTITGGPWYLCRTCQDGLKLKESVDNIPLSEIRSWYQKRVFPQLLAKSIRKFGKEKVSKMKLSASLYGPG